MPGRWRELKTRLFAVMSISCYDLSDQFFKFYILLVKLVSCAFPHNALLHVSHENGEKDMISDIKCPNCNASVQLDITFFPVSDVIQCRRCGTFAKLSIGAIGFSWMASLATIVIPLEFVTLVVTHYVMRQPATWGDICLICLLATPAAFCIIGYFFPGLLIGSIIKLICWRKRRHA
jgi:ribosomal protein S27E